MHRAHHSTIPKWCHPCQREALPLFHLIDPHLHRKTFSWMGKLKIQIVSHVNAATAKSDLCKVWSFFLFDFPISRFNWSFFWMEQKSPAADGCHGLLYSCTVQHHTSNLHSLAKCANCDLICWAWKLPFHNHQTAHGACTADKRTKPNSASQHVCDIHRSAAHKSPYSYHRIFSGNFRAATVEMIPDRIGRTYTILRDFLCGIIAREENWSWSEEKRFFFVYGSALSGGRVSARDKFVKNPRHAIVQPTFSPIIIIIVWPCFIP